MPERDVTTPTVSIKSAVVSILPGDEKLYVILSIALGETRETNCAVINKLLTGM